MTHHPVVIAGAGPTGLMLAGELALAGIDVAIVERRGSQDLIGTRGGGLHARTVEVLDQRGIADRFVSLGQTGQATSFAWIPLDIGDLPSRHGFVLALRQEHIERLLAEWVRDLGVLIRYGSAVTGFTQDQTGVDIELSHGPSLRADYLVGCDGGHSPVRKAAGIEFSGWDPSISNLIAEAEMTEEPRWGLHRDAAGLHAMSRGEDGTKVRIMVTEHRRALSEQPTLHDLSEALIAADGTDYGIHSPSWISRFTDMTRQAAAYRDGRVLLAGDAAHIHYPTGGQGLNLGMQDAVNLGWKLAQVINQMSPECLLDTYHAERYPVAARVLSDTMAQVALLRTDDRTNALRDTMAHLLCMDEPRRAIGAKMSGLDVHYDLGEGHPLVGRRIPDLDLVVAGVPRRLFSLLHAARPVLLELGGPGGPEADPWADRVHEVHAERVDVWELPAIGAVPAPTSVLIRPDGYVAWVGERTRSGLVDALTMWFGTPADVLLV